MTRVKLVDIRVINRHRKDLGDLSELERSIKSFGLLHPVVVTPELILVAGERRLEAVRNMGLDEIPVNIVTTMADAADLLRAERDENTCRKDFTPSEYVALGKALEELERPKAKERQREAGVRHGRGIASDHVSEAIPPVRELVGEALGVSGGTYSRAKTVVEATQDPNPQVASVAKEAQAEMDATGNVSAAARKVRDERLAQGGPDRSPAAAKARREKVRKMASEGYTSRQIAAKVGIHRRTVYDICKELDVVVHADAVVGRAHHIDAERVIGKSIASLEGVRMSLELIKPEDVAGSEELPDWVNSLKSSLQFLNRFSKQLEGVTQ